MPSLKLKFYFNIPMCTLQLLLDAFIRGGKPKNGMVRHWPTVNNIMKHATNKYFTFKPNPHIFHWNNMVW